MTMTITKELRRTIAGVFLVTALGGGIDEVFSAESEQKQTSKQSIQEADVCQGDCDYKKSVVAPSIDFIG